MPDESFVPEACYYNLGVGVRVHVCREDRVYTVHVCREDRVYTEGFSNKPLEFDAIIEKTSITQGVAQYGVIAIDEHDNPTHYRAWFTADELTITDSDRNRGCWIIDKYQQKD